MAGDHFLRRRYKQLQELPSRRYWPVLFSSSDNSAPPAVSWDPTETLHDAAAGGRYTKETQVSKKTAVVMFRVEQPNILEIRSMFVRNVDRFLPGNTRSQ